MSVSQRKLWLQAEQMRRAAFEESLRQWRPDVEASVTEITNDVVQGLQKCVRRSFDNWRPSLKSRDRGRIAVAAARHAFALYPVPAHLERIWLDASGLERNEIKRRRQWYVTVAGGGSLHREHTRSFLSRQETHAFLNPPAKVETFGEALWLAVALSFADQIGAAQRVAQSKLGEREFQVTQFWRDYVRFFCANPTSLNEMNDFYDYIHAMRRRNNGYNLKGRTLASLRRQMAEWHKQTALIRSFPAACWPGHNLADWTWLPASQGYSFRNIRLMIVQLKTAEELVEEGHAMHHCVATYAGRCVNGLSSIWSLCFRQADGVRRLLTIELDQNRRAVQVRGFGNRLATREEAMVLRQWSEERDLDLAVALGGA